VIVRGDDGRGVRQERGLEYLARVDQDRVESAAANLLCRCLKTRCLGDTLVVWKLDRLGSDLRDLSTMLNDMCHRGISFSERGSRRLVDFLFCELLRNQSRLAVYVAAADESDGPNQTGPFVYGRFIGPRRDWTDWFAPVWEGRVLKANPPIPYFYMAEVRNPRWQSENGLTASSAEQRIDEAVRVIASMGSIHIVRTLRDSGHFRKVFAGTRVVRDGAQPGSYAFGPDYIGFLGFARGVLEYAGNHCPEAERVDFVVERKQTVSHYLPHYLGSPRTRISVRTGSAHGTGDWTPVTRSACSRRRGPVCRR
jgi:hypothetical protein